MKKTFLITVLCTAFFLTEGFAVEINNEPSHAVTASENKISTFCLAIVKGDLDTVKKLIELGEDVNARTNNGMTPAMYAARYNRVEILKLLILKDANLKLKSNLGFTAKKYAELSGAAEAMAIIDEELHS